MHQHARLKQQKKKIKELVINAYFISKIKQVKWYRNECKSNYYIYIISKLKKKNTTKDPHFICRLVFIIKKLF